MSLALPEIFPVTCHTDYVGPGSTFVAIKGLSQDGVDYIPLALTKGARTIVVADDAFILPAIRAEIKKARASLVTVENSRKALAQLSAQAAGFPAQKLSCIGITGTKGKTTTVHLIAHLLRAAGHRVAFLSSTKNCINDYSFRASLTTAQPDYLHQFLKLCVQQNITKLIIEVAAQAISLHRIEGILFDAMLFTNFSAEHLEFYSTLNDYFDAKRRLLLYGNCGAPLFINGDDAACLLLTDAYKPVVSFGLSPKHDVYFLPQITQPQLCGTVFCNNVSFDLSVPALIGTFNAYNVAAAVAIALHFQVKPNIIVQSLETFKAVQGRFERHMLPDNIMIIIDHAHNPASYQVVLPVLRSMTHHFIVLFGAGGQRDVTKRPLMGNIAAMYADLLIITADNPRTEDPAQIIADIMAGIPLEKRSHVITEIDRRHAIEIAYKKARPGSVIALLGKGAEEYQIIGTKKIPFNEAEIVQKLAR